MSFSILPDPILLQIFQYLPLKEQLRIGRVNKIFRRISLTIVSETKVLSCDSWTDSFESRDFSFLLSLCSNKLETLTLDESEIIWEYGPRFLNTLARYSCPNLTNLYLDYVENKQLAKLLVKIPNLKLLKVKTPSFDGQSFARFPNVICANLETLIIHPCDSETFNSMAGHVPNLKTFKCKEIDSISINALDNFFRQCPKLESLRLTLCSNKIKFSSSKHFWDLKNLDELSVSDNRNCFPRIPFLVDTDFKKIVQSFPDLSMLDFDYCQIGENGLKALGGLKNMKVLCIGPETETDFDLNQEFQIFAWCELLEVIVICNAVITPETMVAMFSICPKLVGIRIRNLSNIDSPENAVASLKLLAKLKRSKIVISLRNNYDAKVWQNDTVRAAVKELDQNEGILIHMTFWCYSLGHYSGCKDLNGEPC